MGYFNNIGVNVDVNNVHVKRMLDGTPNIDRFYKNEFTPLVEKTSGKNWHDDLKEMFKRDLWTCMSKGLTEDMFDDQGNIDPFINEILNERFHAFCRGWDSRNGWRR